MVYAQKIENGWFKKKHGGTSNTKKAEDLPKPEITFDFPFVF